MELSIYDVLKVIQEENKANEMALRHAVSIFEDFQELSPVGRGMMVEALVEIISEESGKHQGALCEKQQISSK